jgi:tetratricopeptide (TPR) repeat protein
LNYVVDPSTPYIEYSENPLQVDFLQFPRQTLEYRAGDCDDLSICYNAMLQAVAVDTAFITVPGHIFVAFALSLDPDAARDTFSQADNLIFVEDNVWLPVEVTMIHDGFLKAWEQGAKQWRENSVRDLAGFFPVQEAWGIFEAVGLPEVGAPVSIPDRTKVVEEYLAEFTRFIDREIYPDVARLQGQITRANDPSKYVNKLGVLYARYGLTERAASEFRRVLGYGEYLPALVNLGNLEFLSGEMLTALDFYERAERLAPDNPKVLLSVARTHHELENYGLVQRSYSRLKEIDSALADQFGYLAFRGEEAARAARISDVKDMVIWDEEE